MWDSKVRNKLAVALYDLKRKPDVIKTLVERQKFSEGSSLNPQEQQMLEESKFGF